MRAITELRLGLLTEINDIPRRRDVQQMDRSGHEERLETYFPVRELVHIIG
jgi:hypothetical protein